MTEGKRGGAVAICVSAKCKTVHVVGHKGHKEKEYEQIQPLAS